MKELVNELLSANSFEERLEIGKKIRLMLDEVE